MNWFPPSCLLVWEGFLQESSTLFSFLLIYFFPPLSQFPSWRQYHPFLSSPSLNTLSPVASPTGWSLPTSSPAMSSPPRPPHHVLPQPPRASARTTIPFALHALEGFLFSPCGLLLSPFLRPVRFLLFLSKLTSQNPPFSILSVLIFASSSSCFFTFYLELKHFSSSFTSDWRPLLSCLF